MKTTLTSAVCVLVAVIGFTASSLAAENSSATPVPFKVIGSTIQVTFTGGPWQFTLEGRSGDTWRSLATYTGTRTPTATNSAWTSRTALQSANGVVNFPMPRGFTMAQVRVMKSMARYPGNLAKLPKEFTGAPATEPSQQPYGVLASSSTSVAMTASAATTAGLSTSATAVRNAVTESDIWQIAGNRLLFFNQYRGLQVFDISRPQQPVRLGSYRLASRGEQLYTLDSAGSRVALLCAEATADGSSACAVLTLNTSTGTPVLLSKQVMKGYIVDSRLIGSRLYVLTYEYGPSSNAVVIHGYDLTNPAAPAKHVPVTIQGHTPILQASSDTLLVAYYGYDTSVNSRILMLDISGVRGQAKEVKTVQCYGRILNKFNMNAANGVVSAVSSGWNWDAPWWTGTNWSRMENWVETFSLRGDRTTPLGRLEIVGSRGEDLYATRYDGKRLYVVTFFRIDPLFVIDLSLPSQPALVGEVEVPGWSTYIEPWGNRLVAVGIENSSVTASLFDVTNPAAPTLAARVPLGTGYSWSEANYDEKAVNFFPERGLLLLPYQTYKDYEWVGATAVVEVTSRSITHKSDIEHNFTPRRAALAGKNIVSISGQELIIEEASNLAAPRLLAEVPLSWEVNRVLPFGKNHLIQVEKGENIVGYLGGVIRLSIYGQTTSITSPVLRTSPVSDPDALIEEIFLGPGQLVGVEQKNGRLYVAQMLHATDAAPAKLRTTVFDISSPPTVKDGASVETELPALANYSVQFNLEGVKALWPDDRTLLWHLPVQTYWYNPYFYYSTIGFVTTNSSVGTVLTTGTAATITQSASSGVLLSGINTLNLSSLNTVTATASSTVAGGTLRLTGASTTGTTQAKPQPLAAEAKAVSASQKSTKAAYVDVVPGSTSSSNSIATQSGTLNVGSSASLSKSGAGTLILSGTTVASSNSGTGLTLGGASNIMSVGTSSALTISNASTSLALWNPGYWYGYGVATNLSAVVCPVTVTRPDAPMAQSPIKITGPDDANVRNRKNKPFAANGFYFTSYEEDYGLRVIAHGTLILAQSTTTTSSTAPDTARAGVRAWLQVIDFRNPASPVIRNRASLPGELISVSDVDAAGAVLLTSHSSLPREVQACVYDGTSAFQADVWTSANGYDLYASDGAGHLFVAGIWDKSLFSLSYNPASGRLEQRGRWNLPDQIHMMHISNGYLLGSTWGKVHVCPITSSGGLKGRSSFDTPPGLWTQIADIAVVPETGVWMPLGWYGVESLSLQEISAAAVAP